MDMPSLRTSLSQRKAQLQGEQGKLKEHYQKLLDVAQAQYQAAIEEVERTLKLLEGTTEHDNPPI